MYSAHNSVLLWCMVSPCAHGYVLRWSVCLCSMPSKSLQSTGQYTTTSVDCCLKWTRPHRASYCALHPPGLLYGQRDKTCTAIEQVGIFTFWDLNKAISRDRVMICFVQVFSLQYSPRNGAFLLLSEWHFLSYRLFILPI